MTNILSFSRNRSSHVEIIDEHKIKSTCFIQDTLSEGFVEVMAQIPDLEIKAISGEFKRTYRKAYANIDPLLQNLVGVRIGAGVKEIIRGLLDKGEGTDYEELSFMVDECCNAVIITLTKDILMKAPEDRDGKVKFFTKMVRKNTRLLNSCVAFNPQSIFVEGMDKNEPNGK